MFCIDLKPTPKNGEIFQVTQFSNTIVTVEEPNKDSKLNANSVDCMDTHTLLTTATYHLGVSQMCREL